MRKKESTLVKVLLFANVGTDAHGYYHVGDEAMFLQTHWFYRQYFPQAVLSAFVSQPLYPDLQLTEIKGLGWPDTKSEARTYYLKLLFKSLVLRLLGLSLFTQEQKACVDIIRQQQLIHYTGGGNLTSECEHWFYYALFVMSVGWVFGIPVVLTNQTIGPFHSWSDRVLAVVALNTTKSIALRTASGAQLRYLRRLGICRPHLTCQADSAAFLEPAAADRPWLQKDDSVVRIGLSLHPTNNSAGVLRDVIQRMVADLQASSQHVEILLLPHILNTRDEWDTQFMRTLCRGLEGKVTILCPDYVRLARSKAELATEIKRATASCDVVVATRYHGVVFALSENVPCVSIVSGVYQTMKNLEAMRFYLADQAELFCLDIREPHVSQLCSYLLRHLLQKAVAIRAQLTARNGKLQNADRLFRDNLAQEIREYVLP